MFFHALPLREFEIMKSLRKWSFSFADATFVSRCVSRLERDSQVISLLERRHDARIGT